METEEYLRNRLKAIEDSCAYWKKSTDGSYERALYESGWWEIWDKLLRITNEKSEETTVRRDQHEDNQGGR